MKSTVIALIMTLLCTTAQACGNSSDTPGTPQPPAKPGTPSYMNPVIHADAPDPSVIRADDGRFYLYTTGGGYAIYSSANLVDWQYEGKIFSDATRPKLERNGRTADFWAPEIRYIKGKYVVFYTMWFGDVWLSTIGYATCDKPTGPFVDQGLLIDSRPFNVEQSIDQFYYEAEGKSYLFWGSFRGIYAVELDVDDNCKITVKKETMQQVAGNAYEGTNIWKRGDYYYLFASTGDFSGGANSTYRTVVGRSKNMLGPYVDGKGVKMLDNGFNLVLDRNSRFSGPGHNAGLVEDDKGQTWMVYHAYEINNPSKGRQGMLDLVKWTDDGWPFIVNGTPSISAEAPTFDK